MTSALVWTFFVAIQAAENGREVDRSEWPRWDIEKESMYLGWLDLEGSEYSEKELREAFTKKCVATFPLEFHRVPWWRKIGQIGIEKKKTQAFDQAAVAYNALREDPLRWDPDEFWRRRRCALVSVSGRRERSRWWFGLPTGCEDDARWDSGRALRHPLSLAVLRVLFVSRSEAMLRRRRMGEEIQRASSPSGPPRSNRIKKLPSWLSRRVISAAKYLEKHYDASPAAGVYCAAASEALGSRHSWPPVWLPKWIRIFLPSERMLPFLQFKNPLSFFSRTKKENVKNDQSKPSIDPSRDAPPSFLGHQLSSAIEITSYVLWAELLNSTALAVYGLTLISYILKTLGSRTTRRLLSATEATVDALSRQELRVALFAGLALVSWLVLGDALELVRCAQQCVFALFTMRWAHDAIIAINTARRAFFAIAKRIFLIISARFTSCWQRRILRNTTRNPNNDITVQEARRALEDAIPPLPPLLAERVREILIPWLLLEPQRLVAELQNNGAAAWGVVWRDELMTLLRLLAELFAPLLLVLLAMALGALFLIPLLWAVGLSSESKLWSSKWDQVVDLLANDEAPSPGLVFAMNALLVATTLAPLLNAEARNNAKVALSKLAVQLHRRLLAKAVQPRPPQEDDVCAICLNSLLPEKEEDASASAAECKAVEAKNEADELVFCRYGCGKAVHAECMRTWLSQKNECVFCGTLWADD